MYLFFDTETDGLPDFTLPLTHEKQPHVLQLAMILTDENGREAVSWKAPIIPEGFTIDETTKAFEINKIGQEFATKYGVHMATALGAFRKFQDKAVLKVAHNYRFDGFLLKSAHERLNVDPGPVLDKFCTMTAIKEITGKGSLADAYLHCMGKPIEGAHDALSDARACKDVFFWIKNNGHFKAQERKAPKAAA